MRQQAALGVGVDVLLYFAGAGQRHADLLKGGLEGDDPGGGLLEGAHAVVVDGDTHLPVGCEDDLAVRRCGCGRGCAALRNSV